MPPLKPDTLRLPVLTEAADPFDAPEIPNGLPVPVVLDGASEDSQWPRRGFLQMVGAALAAAGLEACTRNPPEKILPYTEQPPEVKPGIPLEYATALPLWGFGIGALVTSWEGHPTKVEGNPDHPYSLGATTAHLQAEPRSLYYANRLGLTVHGGLPTSWKTYLREQAERAMLHEKNGGRGLHFLMEATASPLLKDVRRRIQERFPEARVHGYSSLSRDRVYEGTRVCFGRALEPLYHFDQANIVVSLDRDFLARGPTQLRDARHFTERRDPEKRMNRLYVAESGHSLTGMFADHRLRAKPSELETIALVLIARVATLSGNTALTQALAPAQALQLPPETARWVEVAAKDLYSAREYGALLVGEELPAPIQAAAHALMVALGCVGHSVDYVEPALSDVRHGVDVLEELTGAALSGEVKSLVVTAWNPAWSAPPDLPFGTALAQVEHSVYLAQISDQTAALARWVLPRAHPLESWGDLQAPDGTASLVQPLIEPLFHGRSEYDVLSPWARMADVAPYDALKALWREKKPSLHFDDDFDTWLAKGVIDGTASQRISSPTVQWEALARELSRWQPQATHSLEVRFIPSHALLDGRYQDNAWLHELPDPVTKLTWDNAAQLSPSTAAALGLESYDEVVLELGGVAVNAPVFVLPGHADGAVTLTLGWGHNAPIPHPGMAGFNAYALRTRSALHWSSGLSIRKVGTTEVANPQNHFLQHGRQIAIQHSLSEFEREKKGLLSHLRGAPETLYDPYSAVRVAHEYQWGMGIDLNRCTGCAACVIACQAENSVPVVGKAKVREGRTMHWLRVDRYFSEPDPAGNVAGIVQPLMCVHCEAAPCEYVCPVNATVHDDEGVNQMIYNRCIGTRFCSNNCPYKVRRFNWGDYWPEQNLAETDKMLRNPDVTVRPQGVMEKCTWCVQRIERARIDARVRREKIDTDTLQTACAQVCPTRAIVFGNLKDKNSEVAKRHRDDRRYELLHELGTRPRTVHLMRLKNLNSELA